RAAGKGRKAGYRDDAIAEETQRDQRFGDPLLDADEQAKQQRGQAEEQERLRAGPAVGLDALQQREQEREDRAGEEGRPPEVQPVLALLRLLEEVVPDDQHRGQAQRQVDEEDEAPAD